MLSISNVALEQVEHFLTPNSDSTIARASDQPTVLDDFQVRDSVGMTMPSLRNAGSVPISSKIRDSAEHEPSKVFEVDSLKRRTLQEGRTTYSEALRRRSEVPESDVGVTVAGDEKALVLSNASNQTINPRCYPHGV